MDCLGELVGMHCLLVGSGRGVMDFLDDGGMIGPDGGNSTWVADEMQGLGEYDRCSKEKEKTLFLPPVSEPAFINPPVQDFPLPHPCLCVYCSSPRRLSMYPSCWTYSL